MIDRKDELARDLANLLLGKDRVCNGDVVLIKEYLTTYAHEEIHNYSRNQLDYFSSNYWE